MPLIPSSARPATPWAARRAGDDYGAPDEPNWRDIDWRQHLRSVEIEGRQVNYVDIGPADGETGLPVVFVHGLSGNWQNWLENLPRVAQGRRAIALDLPGFGESETPRGEISMSGYGRTVDAFAEALELGQIALVGNSMGGFISAETAIQFPQRVERLTLVSAVGITTSNLRRSPVLTWGRIIAAMAARSAAERQLALVRPRIRHAVYSPIVRHPGRVPTDMLFEISQGAGRDAFMPALEAIVDYDYRDRVPEIEDPTLIVWGRNDMLVPVRDADEYERLIPNARKLVLDDTGHIAMVERPRTFNDALLKFLDEPRGKQAGDASESAPTAA